MVNFRPKDRNTKLNKCLKNRELLQFDHLKRIEESSWPSKQQKFEVRGKKYSNQTSERTENMKGLAKDKNA